MKKIVLFSVLVGLMIMIPSIFLKKGKFENRDGKINSERMHQIIINGQKLDVEVVTTSEEFRQGLSGRNQIGSDGMLFAFPIKQQPSFWMKDMLFNIDIIWINDDQVVEITKNVPRPENTDQQLPRYSPKKVVNYVLEVDAGVSDRLNLSVGDKVVF